MENQEILKDIKIKKILFKSDENFIIAITDNNLTIKGNIFEDGNDLIDVKIDFIGKTETNLKFGQQFHFTSYTIKSNYTFFFLTSIVKGIQVKSANEIIAKFGDKFGDIVENNPKLLLTIKGIGEAKLKDIVASYQTNKHLKSLADMLLPYGITPNVINKIYTSFKDESVSEIKANPYLLTRIKGIGFKKADEIAQKFGILLTNPNRIKSAILFAMETNISDGHTYIQKDSLIEKSIELLNTETFFCEDFRVENEIITLEAEQILIKFNAENQLYATRRMYEMELFINVFFKKNAKQRLSSNPIVEDISGYIQSEEERIGFSFSEKQRQIIELANQRYKIISLSGYAGAGKTTSAQSVLRLFEKLYSNNDIVCCALSGAAANRAKTVTGYRGYTIHSLLEFSKDGFGFHKDNKLTYKVILLDEGSMVDTYLFYSLLQAIDIDNTILIIAGDPAQLQPVGAGNVYKDILDFDLCSNVTLDKVYRQKEEQVINIFAQSIRLGEVPKNITAEYEDFNFFDVCPRDYWAIKQSKDQKAIKKLSTSIQNETLDRICEIAIKNDPAEFYQTNITKFINHFQIISPMKAGTLGVDNLNLVVQSLFNNYQYPNEIETSTSRKFKPRDKVMHFKNENMNVVGIRAFMDDIQAGKKIDVISDGATNSRRVFNGQFGVILDIFNNIAAVYYPNEHYVAFYTKQNFSEGMIGLAYAISIHKSQGSQFDNVVIPSSMSHYIMLNNQLMYTAVTRAKDKLSIIGEKMAFETACRNKTTTHRNTILSVLNH